MPSDQHSPTSLRRHEDLRIPADGHTVSATRYEPTEHDGPLPALLMYVPYPRDDVITYGAYDPLLRYLAERGYEVVVADMVGTGGSTGFLEQLFTRREGREPADIVEWLADREWTTGRVGVFGKSYGGITALDAAAQRPDGLEAIVPIHTPYEGVRNAYTHGGAFELLNIGMNWLTLMQALEVKPPSWRDEDGQWADAWKTRLDRVRDRKPFLFQFLDHGPEDEYWDDKNIPVERIDTPTFAVGGWRDSYTRDTFEYVDAIDAPTRLLMGPWRHTMPHRGRESAVDFRRQVVDWFDRFLKGEETGVLDWPEIRYYTERDGGRTPGAGAWRGRRSWPGLDDASEVTRLALSADGLVDAEAFETGTVERTYAVDHTLGFDAVDPSTATLDRVDTTPDDARSLTFETGSLDAPVELTGSGRATLRVAGPSDHLVVVRVVDVAPDGTAAPVTRGILRYGGETADGAPVARGEGRTLTVPLQPRSHVFEAGHRVRVAVGASHFPLVTAPPRSGELTVRSSPETQSTVAFPGGRRDSLDFDDAVRMAGPDRSRPVASASVDGRSGSWEVTRDKTGGEARMRKTTEYDIDVPHAKRVSRRESYAARASADDPAGAVAESRLELDVDYGTERVSVVASNRIGADLTEVTTRVLVDDRPLLDETWVR